jgi:hypothetical protein
MGLTVASLAGFSLANMLNSWESMGVFSYALPFLLFFAIVFAILEKSQIMATRFFGLQVLQETISIRWQILPLDQREGIRNYIVTKIISLSNQT